MLSSNKPLPLILIFYKKYYMEAIYYNPSKNCDKKMFT